MGLKQQVAVQKVDNDLTVKTDGLKIHYHDTITNIKENNLCHTHSALVQSLLLLGLNANKKYVWRSLAFTGRVIRTFTLR